MEQSEHNLYVRTYPAIGGVKFAPQEAEAHLRWNT